MASRQGWAFLFLAAAGLAACGDSDLIDDPDPVCGNGIEEGTEECDDGNTVGGDGCSASCRDESITALCGNGTLDSGEACDDRNFTDGDGCTSCQVDSGFTCTGSPSVCTDRLCGNGAMDAGEACDDMNFVDNDGCTACQIDTGFTCTPGFPSVCTPDNPPGNGTCAEPFYVPLLTDGMGGFTANITGTTVGSTNQFAAGLCNGASNTGAGVDVIYTFTIAATSSVEILSEDTSFDAVLRLTTTACDIATMVPDYFGDGCSDEYVSLGEELFYPNLAAGTYYLVVDGYGASAAGAFDINVTVTDSTCGDGTRDLYETCDDGDTMAGDGCSPTCTVETGFACSTGSPSVCAPAGCGNAIRETGEACDDGDTDGGDGCSATCTVETGFVCSGAVGSTSFCAMAGCGNNIRETGEACDDGDTMGGDGCSATCTVESGYVCTGTVGFPSMCEVACGNGRVNTGETCDDDDTDSGDGCSATCQIETGYACTGGTTAPSVCTRICGNSTINTGETCDDGDFMSGDGCSDTCQIEIGWACSSTSPSMCAQTCGNGVVDTNETCDDGDNDWGDGCNDVCKVETGWTCTGAPSVCTAPASTCNASFDSTIDECEDMNTVAGDGCNSCLLEYDVLEVENNGTTPQVLPLTFVGTQAITRVRGRFNPAGDVDLYQFTLTEAASVTIETYNAIDGSINYFGRGGFAFMDCFSLDTKLALFPQGASYALDSAARAIDDNDGDINCSYIGNNDEGGNTTEGNLPAGTYVIRVTAAAASPRYILHLSAIKNATVAPGALLINEVLANPGTGTTADSNCDGTGSSTNDEFIELVNAGTTSIDLSGFTIADSIQLRFTFQRADTGRMVLTPGESVVVWGGGAPACPGVTNWFRVGSSSALSLDNADTITIKSPAGATVATRVYTGATTGISQNLNPDATGSTYANHDTVPGAGTLKFSPGRKVDGTAWLP